MTTNEKQQVAIIQKACRESLKFLCKKMLGMKDWSENKLLHDSIAAHLKKPSKFKLILVPRDHLKSSIITKGWSIQNILNNPDIRILVGNNTWDNARKFLRSIQLYLAPGNLLSTYFGTFTSNHWNQDEMTIRQRKTILDAPTIATTGLEKEQTSQHYDLIIGDDLVAKENVTTPEQRQKVKDYVQNLLPLMEPNATLVLVGTRWSQDDAYGDLIDSGEWDVLNLGAFLNDERTEVLFPEKFNLERLGSLRRKMGPYLFSCQYLNNPIDQDAADFKKEQIRFYDPTTENPSNLFLSIDPALSLSRDADFSALVVAGQFPNRQIRVVDRVRRRMVPSDLVDQIFALVKKWHLHRVGVETFAFQKTLKYDIQRQQKERGVFFSIYEFGRAHNGRGEPNLSKEARIRRLQPYFEQGLVEIRPDMQDFADELLAFPRGKHDDMIDALSHSLDFLMPSAGTSLPDETIQYVHTPMKISDVMRETLNRNSDHWIDALLKDLKKPIGIPTVRR